MLQFSTHTSGALCRPEHSEGSGVRCRRDDGSLSFVGRMLHAAFIMTRRANFAAVTSRGFTLIELLVVIAIITLLLDPHSFVTQGQGRGRRVVCSHNLRQIGLAMVNVYARLRRLLSVRQRSCLDRSAVLVVDGSGLAQVDPVVPQQYRRSEQPVGSPVSRRPHRPRQI